MSESSSSTNDQQKEYWNARAGETWAQFQEQLDRQILPLGNAAIDRLAPAAGERILDIGCGCGQTTIQLAKRVGPAGCVAGIDISRPMLAVARARPDLPANAAFLELDAQAGAISTATGIEAFDAAFSRFGVMFFSDPAAAFRNIRSALRRAARLCFVCWRPLAENPWMRVPMEAALPFLPPMPPSDPLQPGPFAFANPDRVRQLLGAGGFTGVEITPFDANIGIGNLEQTLALTFRVGPLGAVLREHPQYRDRVEGAVRAALAAHEGTDGVVLPAAVWIVGARAP